MVKPGKFGHLHLVYHFTVPLKNDLQDFVNKSLEKKNISEDILGKIDKKLLSRLADFDH